MTCAKCGLETRIVSSATRPEAAADGGMQIVHVNNVRCLNKQCSEYEKVFEHKVVLWQGEMPQNAIVNNEE